MNINNSIFECKSSLPIKVKRKDTAQFSITIPRNPSDIGDQDATISVIAGDKLIETLQIKSHINWYM